MNNYAEITERINYLIDRIAFQTEQIAKNSSELESLTAMLDYRLESANEVMSELTEARGE